MDFAALKGKTVDDALIASLTEHAASLTAKASDAEAKAREARAATSTKARELQAQLTAAYEKLGVSSAEELAALPDGKGQAEANAQAAARIKSLERERDDARKQAEALSGELKTKAKAAALDAAIGSIDWIDPDDARAKLVGRLHEDGDQVLYKTKDDKLITLADAAATLAKTSPHLIKPAGSQAQGSGWRGTGDKHDPASIKITGDKNSRVDAIAAKFNLPKE